MARDKHPKKELEAVVEYAEQQGWDIRPGKRHAKFKLGCKHHDREGCKVSVWSTPSDVVDHARDVRRALIVARTRAQERRMKKFEFAIIASGLDPEDEDFEGIFYEAGCADATLSFQKGVIIVEFNRKAVTFSQAVISACENVVAAGAKIERIEPDHLVSITEMSERSPITKQAISLYSDGKRGNGFPNPAACVTTKHPLWDWSEVAEWLYDHRKISLDAVVQARIVKEANVHFEANELPNDNFTRKLEALENA